MDGCDVRIVWYLGSQGWSFWGRFWVTQYGKF